MGLTSLWLAGALAAAAAPGDRVVENDALALHLRTEPVAHVSALVHKASGVNLLNGTEPAPVFTLSLGPEGAGGATLSSLDARRSETKVERLANGTRATLTYSEFAVQGLEVTVTLSLPARGPLATWSLRMRLGAPTLVRSVRFPQFAAVPALGDAADDSFVLPSLPGALVRNPAQAWGPGQSVWLSYPGGLSAQFIAYQDPKAGLYLAGQDSEARPRRLGIWRQATGFGLAHDYVPDPGEVTEWQTPYPCVAGVTQGTWHETADLYKAWAVHQPWCRQRLTQRKDVPAWWKAGPLVHVCEVRTYGDGGVQTGSFYPNLAAHVAELRRRTESDVVMMAAGWEQHRRWSAGDYFPIFDEAAARPVFAQLKAEGTRPFVFLSGLFWTFFNEGANGGHPQVPDAWLPAFVRDAKSGEPQTFVLNETTPGRGWKRNSYQFCVTPAATRTFLHQVVDRAHALGIDLLQMDQTTGGGGSACAAANHGHPVGSGAYQTQGFVALLRDMRAYGKRKSPDFLLLHEEPHEELIPVLDGFHVREYKERWWYRGTPGAVGIPLFSYLYHEYAVGYGGDSAPLTVKPDPWCVRAHAVNLVTGRTPGISVWSSPQLVSQSDPAPLEMVRQHARLLKRGGAPFLMEGRMLHPLRLDVPDTTYQVPVQRKEGWRREPFVEPSVLTSSWQGPDGRIAHVFANPTGEAQKLTVDLDTRNAPAWPAVQVSLFSGTGGGEFTQVAARAPLPYRLSRELAPLEVLCVVLKRAP